MQAAVQQGNGTTGSRALILVVHANGTHARPVETLLEGAGYEVVSASEADEILTLITYGNPDLVVVVGGKISLLPEQLTSVNKSRVLIVGTDMGTETTGATTHYRCALGSLLETVSWCLTSSAIG